MQERKRGGFGSFLYLYIMWNIIFALVVGVATYAFVTNVNNIQATIWASQISDAPNIVVMGNLSSFVSPNSRWYWIILFVLLAIAIKFLAIFIASKRYAVKRQHDREQALKIAKAFLIVFAVVFAMRTFASVADYRKNFEMHRWNVAEMGRDKTRG